MKRVDLTVLSSRVDCGEEPLEDLTGRTDNATWVIDGASGMGERDLTDFDSDGVWFVETFDECLKKQTANISLSLSEIISTCINEVRIKFENYISEQINDPMLEPTGAISLVRERGSEIEYLVLGDCSLVIKKQSGNVETILGEGPREFDKRVVEEVINTMEREGVSYETAYSAARPMLKEHRRMKNKPDGYWTLGFEGDAVSHAKTGRISANNLDRLYLFSDGFELLVPTYDIFADWAAATDYIDANGIERTFQLLRDIERSDPECRRYPRLKPMDDASLVVVECSWES